MKKSVKIIGISVIVIISLLGLAYIASSLLAPGSYVNAEEYEMSTNEETLIHLIADFKRKNPEYTIPHQVGVADGRRDTSDHWYHIYFYYPEKNEIVKTWLRPSGSNTTTLAFVAINYSQTLGNWKSINKDFSNKENRERKKEFEERILFKIRQNIK